MGRLSKLLSRSKEGVGERGVLGFSNFSGEGGASMTKSEQKGKSFPLLLIIAGFEKGPLGRGPISHNKVNS